MKPIKIHDTLPIYSAIGNGSIPVCCVYGYASALGRPYYYIGESCSPIKRYKKIMRAALGNQYYANDSRANIDAFKQFYQEGSSPVMVILAEAEDKVAARLLEKQYREKHSDSIINTTKDRKPYSKDIYHKQMWNIADWLYYNWLIILLIIIVTISLLFYAKKNQHDLYNYSY